MMGARDEVFGNIRRSLGVRGDERTRRGVVEDRLARSPKGLIPQRGQVSGEERIAVFSEQAESVQASVTRVADRMQVPEAIAAYLRDHNLPAELRMGSDPRLASMPWGETSLSLKHGVSDGSDLNAVSHAYGGIAETGTLVMVSGADNPSTLNLLPDNHIVVVDAAEIAGDYEAMWERLRATYGKGVMPRTVNYITGPSRSGDIEQTLLLGAHGPRRVHIIVVGKAAA
jgi:L-lactate dehydrogenase complex protein LldG